MKSKGKTGLKYFQSGALLNPMTPCYKINRIKGARNDDIEHECTYKGDKFKSQKIRMGFKMGDTESCP